MPDVLTHVLVGFAIGTLLSLRYEWLGPEFVTLAMIGALSPDFTKIKLLVPSETIAATLGVPFDWGALHVLGGSVVVVLLGSLLIAPEYRTRALALFAIGAASHLVLDALLLTVTGHSFALFWPLTAYHPPTPNLYLSSDRWPALVAATAAALVWTIRYRRHLNLGENSRSRN